MSDTTTQAETTTERKPPTIADIVREKTGDGALIIDFFTDVMTGRIDGAELCHRIDAAKQLVKYGSKDAAEFIAKYKGVPCGHSINGRPNPADPCSVEERSLVAVTLNAPPTLTRDFLTVLSGIDEFLMTRLIRAQTADGVTVIEFLDDVMQDRTDGFKTHHRIAAAKELIVHIVRDEQPSHTPSPSTRETDKRGDTPAVGADPRVRPLPGSKTPSPLTGEGWSEGDTPAVGADPRVRPLPGSKTPSPSTGEGWGEGDSPVVPAQAEGNPDNTIVVPAKAGTQRRGGVAQPSKAGARPEPNTSVVPAPTTVVPAESLPRTRYGAGTQGRGGARNTPANPARAEPVSTAESSAHPEPNSSVVPAHTTVVPAKAGTHPRDPEPGSQLETNNSKLETLPARRPRKRRTRTQRRRDGNARAAIRREALGSERNKEEQDEKPAPVELTIAERRIKERLEQHWHEPDPYGAPIDSASPGRSPP